MVPPPIPRKFRERYNKIMPDRRGFYRALVEPLPPAIRINTLKIGLKEGIKRLSEKFELERLPFCDFGFRVRTELEKLGNTLEHFMGYYYVQEAVSMIPPLLMELKPHAEVLDLCAAPGSKTTEIAQLMRNSPRLIANDVTYWRLKALVGNLERCGVLNTLVTNYDGVRFPRVQLFDAILLDAPCSSEGTIRRNWKALSGWSENIIRKLSALQRALLRRALSLLKPGGVLVYSTCTFAPEENEAVLAYALEKFDVKLEKIKLRGWKVCPGLTEWDGQKFPDEVARAIRIWPHLNDSGGFFVAKLRKK